MKNSLGLIAGLTALFYLHCSLSADSLDVWHVRRQVELNSRQYPICVAYGDGVFVSGGAGGALASSTDGISWTNRLSGSALPIFQIAYGNGTFLALAGSDVLASPDGIDWTLRTLGTTYYVSGITFGKGLFLVVGDNGNSLTSSDGINWISRNVGTNAQLVDAAFAGGMFFATLGGPLMTSSDAIRWTPGVTGINSALRDVVYGNGVFVAVGDGDVVLRSLDGIDWANVSFKQGFFSFYKAAFASGVFVVVGSSGQIWTSIDGANWIERNSKVGSTLRGVTFGKGTFVAAGDGVILQSDPLPTSVADAAILSLRLYAGIEITGNVGRSYNIEYTDDLASTNTWKPLSMIQLPSSPYLWFDVASPNISKRVYRAVFAP